ncbi:MAG TPA: peptide deformylase [Bacteroidales bacterium]|nr:peptide deformylase [Bacteroidales bacterium]
MKVKLDRILKLGDQRLYDRSEEISPGEIDGLRKDIDLLFELIFEFRRAYGEGRGIAAPQIGLMKRIFCLYLDDKRHVIINPVLKDLSEELMEVWDYCMCFPVLMLKVFRHRSCLLTYRDENWEEHTWELEGDLSQLIQHEYDHLDGILATQRVIDNKSIKLR